MSDDEEVLIVDLIPLDFTLQHLGRDDFVKLRVGRKERNRRNLRFKKTSTHSGTLKKIQVQRPVHMWTAVFSTCR